MNSITLHGKVVKGATMHLVTIGNEPTPVAVFTVCDIGLPYQKAEPLFIQVNYKKEAASLINKYLVEDKEVLIHGVLRQKFLKDEKTDETKVHYYVLADMVELLPVFTNLKTDKNHKGEKNEKL